MTRLAIIMLLLCNNKFSINQKSKKTLTSKMKHQMNSNHCENNMRLLRAAASGDILQARQAIEQGADINCCDCNNHTPLHLACSRNYAAFVDFLIVHGAKNDTKCMQESSGAAKPRARLAQVRTCRETETTCDFRRCHSQSSTLAADALRHSFPAPVADAMMRALHVAALSKPSVSYPSPPSPATLSLFASVRNVLFHSIKTF